MRTRSVLGAALLAGLVAAGTSSAAAADSAQPLAGVRVELAQDQLRAVVGEHFDYRPRIVNSSATAIEEVLAHLNVASLSTDVYVDPEDWSTNRSIVIPRLGPGASTSLSWDLQAVSAGTFALYVVLLPTGSAAPGALVVSPPARLVVASRASLTAGGSLPVIIAVPSLLALGVAVSRRRIRRASG